MSHWKIGRHSLRCADSREIPIPTDAVALVWDPDWNDHIPPPNPNQLRHKFIFTDSRNLPENLHAFGVPAWVFVWDCVSSWWTPSSPLMRMKLCLWYGPRSEYSQGKYLLKKRQPKRVVRNNRGAYLYHGRPGTMLSDIYCQPITEPRSHRHAKPTDWVSAIIGNCIMAPSRIYDPFAGSCTSILAAEATGHTCDAVEISPSVCDAALARMEGAGFQIEQAEIPTTSGAVGQPEAQDVS